MSEKLVVTFNAGSSSLRCGVFKLGKDGPVQVRNFHVRGLPDSMVLTEKNTIAGTQSETDPGTPTSADSVHPEALAQVFSRLDGAADLGTIAAFSHRIVHGGAEYAAPVLIDDTVLAQLKTLEPLARSHRSHNLRPIRQVQRHFFRRSADRLF